MAKSSTAASKPTRASRKPGSVSWPQAVRDIVVAAINRGQLPSLGAFLVALLLIWKLPEAEVVKLVIEVLTSLRRLELLAYVLLFIVLIGWFTHARLMRKVFSDEMERIGLEKSELQGKLSQTNYRSSNDA